MSAAVCLCGAVLVHAAHVCLGIPVEGIEQALVQLAGSTARPAAD